MRVYVRAGLCVITAGGNVRVCVIAISGDSLVVELVGVVLTDSGWFCGLLMGVGYDCVWWCGCGRVRYGFADG